MPWRRVAEIIAREAAYRSGKKAGRSLRLFKITGGSMIKYNAFILSILTFVSISVGLGAFAGREFAYPSLVMLFILEVMMGVLFMALNLQALISDRLLEPLFHLPLSESDIRKALSWVGIYWGGASLPFVLIPGGVLMSYLLKDLQILLGAVIGSIIALFLSFGLGYLAGSMSTRYTRSLRGKVASTIVWLLFLGIGFLMGPLMDVIGNMVKGSPSELLALIPPVSFSFMFSDPLALLSSLLIATITYGLLKFGMARFWRAATRGEVPLPKGPVGWSLSFGLRAAILREIKVVSRTPRMLASVIMYSFIFPLSFFLIPALSEGLPPEFLKFLPLISLTAGGLGGFSILYMYISEAEGAKTLYPLPLSRMEIALMKFYAYLTLNLPVALPIASVIAIISFPHGLVSALIYLAALAGSALLNSSIYAGMLPKEPSHWSSETFNRTSMAALFIVEGIAYFAIGMSVLFVPGAVSSEVTPLGAALIWVIGVLLLVRNRRRII